MRNIIVIILLAMVLVSCSTGKKACFEGKCITLEVRDTQAGRALGLMGREKLDDDEGMLFVFEKPGIYSFWMKNMKISIDMIWIDSSGVIVHIEEDVPPCVTDSCDIYSPGAEAVQVIETSASFVTRYDVVVGDKVEFK
jgi:hypothetical protein